MSRVLRMKPDKFWWEQPDDPAAHLGYVTFACPAPTADPWEIKFPRYHVAYGGILCYRDVTHTVDHIAEHSIAEQVRDHILAATRYRRAFTGLWAEVRDEGRAPYEAFDDGAAFWAARGYRTGISGRIIIRHRYHAAVQWDDDPHPTNALTYNLDLMSATRPDTRPLRSMN